MASLNNAQLIKNEGDYYGELFLYSFIKVYILCCAIIIAISYKSYTTVKET